MDANSTDRTMDIVQDILPGCGRQYGIYHTNGPERYTPMGLMWGYQVGAGNSTGEYLTFIGDDDLCHPSRFSYMVNALEEAPESPCAHSRIHFINGDGTITGSGGGPMNDILHAAVMTPDDPQSIHVTGFSMMFRKWAYYQQQCYTIGSYFWEMATTFRMYALGDLIYVPESILYFRYWDRQGDACTYRGAMEQGYDPNLLSFGKYNYALDIDMREEVSRLGLSTAYLDGGEPVDEDWKVLIGLFVTRFKTEAARRFKDGVVE